MDEAFMKRIDRFSDIAEQFVQTEARHTVILDELKKLIMDKIL